MRQEGLTFNRAYTSYLKRAIKTLNIALDVLDQDWLPVEKHWRLNEKPLWSAARIEQKRDCGPIRRRAGPDLRRSYDIAPDALSETDPRNPKFDSRYAQVPNSELPRTESLKDTIKRILPYWEKTIFPRLKFEDQLLIVAHGNSLRGIIKYLKRIPDNEIVRLNLPTAVPYVFEFDHHLNLTKDYFLGDPDEIRRKTAAVANQGTK